MDKADKIQHTNKVLAELLMELHPEIDEALGDYFLHVPTPQEVITWTILDSRVRDFLKQNFLGGYTAVWEGGDQFKVNMIVRHVDVLVTNTNTLEDAEIDNFIKIIELSDG